MKAIWRGQVIAESDRTLEVGGYQYFPRETGGVQFYDVVDGAVRSDRAAWSYEVPRASMKPYQVARKQLSNPGAAFFESMLRARLLP